MARKTTTQQESENANTPKAEEQAAIVQTAEHKHNTAVSDCGGVLKQAREKLNLTVHDVSTSLRLSDKQIEAMEADQFHLLPQPSIVRGFIRNYAKIVKIESDPIVAAYNARVPDSAPQSFTVKSNTTQSVIGEHKAGFSPSVFAGLMLLFAAIIGGFYYYTQQVKPNAAKPETPVIASSEELNVDVTANSVSAEFALPSAERQVESVDSHSGQTSPVNQNTSTTELALPPSSSASNQAPTAEIASSTSTAVVNPQLQADTAMTSNQNNAPVDASNQENVSSDNTNALSTSTLKISATEETWVNIVNSRGKQIYSKVLAAGQSDSITANPPLKVTVGNAQHTSLNFNGQTIDLATHTRNKVARLTINE
jgi:cytoskeleton protein RodZ